MINPFKCENCKMELQPNDIMVGTNEVNGNLVKMCAYCGNVIEINEEKEKEEWDNLNY
jgi:hypothetical protein